MRERSNDFATIRINTRDMRTSNLADLKDSTINNSTRTASNTADLHTDSKLVSKAERNVSEETNPIMDPNADHADPAESKQTLLEQARARSSLFHPQGSSAWNQEAGIWLDDAGHTGKRQLGLTKKAKNGMFAGALGICAGLLLGFGAYYLFTSTSGFPSINRGKSSSADSNQTAATSASAQNAAAETGSTPQTANVLGPGGATGPGTTVYLYQLGIYRDANSADQVAEQLNGKGISVIKRGNGLYQLIAGAATTKSGFSDFNQLLQDQSVAYYMKPFVVPTLPASIAQASASMQQLQKSLQAEWNAVQQLNNGSDVSVTANVQKNVQQALAQLPQSKNAAKTELSASLQDLKDLANEISADTNSTAPQQAAKQSYALGKFYTDFAQGVADLSL